MMTEHKHPLPPAKPPARKGGRPSQARAEKIRDEILDIATHLFLTQGYGATSIEAIAQQAGMSKRTFYHRFANKAELFGAVLHQLTNKLRPKQVAPLFTGGTLEEILLRLATVILRATLTPDALALHRLLLTEAVRFPELAVILSEQGARQEALERMAALLESHMHTGSLHHQQALIAAEQFMQLVVAVPQRRAMLGTPMGGEQLTAWARDAVLLFLHGCRLSMRT
jgi:AcrR family transcriptional regulator